MTGHCLCGAVSVTLDAAPAFINDCNCGLCRKVGAGWGYFKSSAVSTHGETIAVIRNDKEAPFCEVHSCAVCAATTHYVLTESYRKSNPSADVVGANMRLFDPNELAGVEVRFPNGKDWPGSGDYSFRRPAVKIGVNGEW